ncbi:MAG: biotin/lipoate A/B protein ligase family protein [Corynebacterium sp.]|uniref:biotin/lipoate A/B protein ligase family protein n=1 Tax=Corynebacterium camporealensis TaxID=161896 RepID=UPI002A795A51|nr:biotin/lipoate A/B protein ligase family protein [Corynebacterium camporealensis]MDY3126867.1 biotin/lipoate A/B protein ligase family protein [Corynebacterium sp.]MDY5839792.1 biotin/lipoate A/B protein ligase family protein [Corynebacterium camporealensis]
MTNASVEFSSSLVAPAGALLSAEVSAADNKITAVTLNGNFAVEPAEAREVLTSALKATPLNEYTELVQARLDTALEEYEQQTGNSVQLEGFTTRDLAQVVRRAISQAVNFEDLDWEILHTDVMPSVLNVALEEVLLEQVNTGQRGPTLRFWEWEDCATVIGSFQSYTNEVYPEGVEKHNVQVVRRISGGGTMFMDGGKCITYSLYVPEKLVAGLSHVDSYEFLDRWVVNALNDLGVKCWYIPINDITASEGKLAGAAQKRRGRSVLHHTTMSYEMNTEKMLDVLRTGKPKILDKGLPSANKRVDSISRQTTATRAEVIDALQEAFITRYGGNAVELDSQTLNAAKELVDAKYTSPTWTHRVP